MEVSVGSLAYPGVPGAWDVRCGGYLTAAVKRPFTLRPVCRPLHRITSDGPRRDDRRYQSSNVFGSIWKVKGPSNVSVWPPAATACGT
ncbi:hypothetical protein [Dactylosporangium sp. NPDC049140]|uniref:hypothetical protein n=1 Tax=Dactylosporangium sp. NPDC049140 TaxID=3155647 RepID=UPI0033D3ABCA